MNHAATLRELRDRLTWHYDPNADESDLSPTDQVAHVNGLCVRAIDRALSADDRTHYEGCWRYHQGCAVALVESLIDTLVEVRRYVDGESPQAALREIAAAAERIGDYEMRVATGQRRRGKLLVNEQTGSQSRDTDPNVVWGSGK